MDLRKKNRLCGMRQANSYRQIKSPQLFAYLQPHMFRLCVAAMLSLLVPMLS